MEKFKLTHWSFVYLLACKSWLAQPSSCSVRLMISS